MTAVELVRRLRQDGVTLWVEGGRLCYRAPKGVLTPALRDEMLAHKLEIMALLQAPRSASLTKPPQRIPRDGVLPLSSIQERFWLLGQLDPDSPAYNIPMAWRIEGPLDLVALEHSLDAIVQRHEILRAACVAQQGRPQLVIEAGLRAVLTVTDLRSLPPHARESRALQLATEEARRPFDLAQPPLLRASLVRLDRDLHLFVLVTHHFVADGWSMAVLIHELSVLFESFLTGVPASLPELPIQYVDLAQWERDNLATGAFDTQLDYWMRRLKGAPPQLDLPLDRPRPPEWSFRGATYPFSVASELAEALAALSRREGNTLFLTVLTAFQVLLHQYTQRDDIITGTAVSRRNWPEAENLIGSFANSLVLRTDLSGDPTFREALGRVRSVAWEAFAHQDLPFHQLVNTLLPGRSLAAHPLYQVSLLWHHRTEEQRLRLRGLNIEQIAVELGTSRLDLSLEMWHHEPELSGVFQYSTDLFDAATVRRMAVRFMTLLESATACPDVPISRLSAKPQTTHAQPPERRSRLSPEKRTLFEKRLQQALAPPREPQLIPLELWPIPRESTGIPPRPDQSLFPLSFAQERFWYLDQLEPGNPTYNRPLVLRLRGSLEVWPLEQSLTTILRRHQVLRATFPWMQGRPVQIITEPSPVRLPVVNLDELPPAEREPRARQLAVENAWQPFDLKQGPLLRATLLRMDNEEHLLVLVVHHIAFDAWSARLVVDELGELYEAFAQGKPSPLSEPPIQYVDFAHWQRQRLQGEAVESQLSYWKTKLADFQPLPNLPMSRPRPAVQTHRGARQVMTISRSLQRSLHALSRREGATLFMTLLAGFKTLLHRYTGQNDIVVGSVIAGRTHVDIERLIGFCGNTLVLRTDLSGDPTFRELLRRVRETALHAYANQDVPFEKLVEELRPQRTLDRTPLFQVLFNLENIPPSTFATQSLEIEEVDFDSAAVDYDLSVELIEKDGSLSGWWQYSTDLFDAATIARMAAHFQVLLDGIIADPDRRLWDLPLLAEAERHQLLAEWNATPAGDPKDVCVHQLFEVQVQRTPDASAVVCGDAELTYRELNCRANRLAHRLRECGVGPEVLVGICAERSLEMVVGLMGILKAGGAYVPLDPWAPRERLDFMIRDASISVLVTEQRFLKSLPEHQARVVRLDADWEAISQEIGENPDSGVVAGNLAYVIYTSGSTGNPKGVAVEHRSLAAYTETACAGFALSPSDRVLQFASISFDAAVEEIFPCLVSGATLVLRSDSMLDSAAVFLNRCHEWRVTVLDLPTSYWHHLVLEMGEDTALPRTVRLVIIGGEKALKERLGVWHRHVEPRVRLVNTYGPTEATVVATWCDLPATKGTSAVLQEVPIGRPIRNVQVYLLDRKLQPVPIGIAGELCIGGVGLARGYLNQPAFTAERFVPHPFSEERGARLYRSGDMARYRPDGNIEYLGRLDHQVKVRGFRIELGEVESVLTQYPAVREVVVAARDDGEGSTRLVAYVVPHQIHSSPTSMELRRFLEQKLPDYMVPSAIVFLEALPQSPSAKVDRGALLALDEAGSEPSGVYAAPGTATERLLAEVWQEVLSVDRVGVYDNFFDLGGHSLLSVQVIARLEQRLGVRINPREMIRQTLGQLAALYEERMHVLESPEPSGHGQKVRGAKGNRR